MLRAARSIGFWGSKAHLAPRHARPAVSCATSRPWSPLPLRPRSRPQRLGRGPHARAPTARLRIGRMPITRRSVPAPRAVSPEAAKVCALTRIHYSVGRRIPRVLPQAHNIRDCVRAFLRRLRRLRLPHQPRRRLRLRQSYRRLLLSHRRQCTRHRSHRRCARTRATRGRRMPTMECATTVGRGRGFTTVSVGTARTAPTAVAGTSRRRPVHRHHRHRHHRHRRGRRSSRGTWPTLTPCTSPQTPIPFQRARSNGMHSGRAAS